MARLIGTDPFQQDDPGSGFRFEREVREVLRRPGLPNNTYMFAHSVYIPGQHASGSGRAPVQPREIDFVVAGPNGLFFLETKKRDVVSGRFTGPWTYSWANPGGPVQEPFVENEIEKARKKVSRAGTLIQRRGLPAFARGIRFIFVFPNKAQLNLTNDADQPPLSSYPFFAVHLSELVERIREQPDSTFGGQQGALTTRQVGELLRVFVHAPIPAPRTTVHYEILQAGPSRTAANGLQFQRLKLKHRLTKDLRGGKTYDMEGLVQHDRSRYEEQITRHFNVATTLPAHDLIARPLEIIPDAPNGQILVVESWVEGEDLESAVDSRGRKKINVRQVLHDIALALEVLHGKRFVLRDLRPGAVFLTERKVGDGPRRTAAMLIDFEAAKDFDAPVSVFAGNAPPDPFRAPELERHARRVDVRADVFSWGAIAFWLLTGKAPDREMSVSLPVEVPAPVADVVRGSLSEDRTARPASISTILEALRSWN